MIGERIKELREKAGWHQDRLAKESRLAPPVMAGIERGIAKNIDHRDLIKIADALHLSQEEFIYLVNLNQHSRRFQAYNIGVVKTGTHSIAGIFKNYRSRHEYSFVKASEMIMKFKKGKITREGLKRYVRTRDNKCLLEMDAAFFNYCYLDILTEEFPSAKFIFTIRDCYSWVDSLINMFLGGRVRRFRFTKFLFGMDHSICASKKRLLQDSNNLIDRLLAYWNSANCEIIKKLPPHRSLIVRTCDISNNIGKIADFIGVPKETLDTDNSRLFKGQHKFNILHQVEYKFLNKKFNQRCSSLMRRFFPGHTLKSFLQDSERLPHG